MAAQNYGTPEEKQTRPGVTDVIGGGSSGTPAAMIVRQFPAAFNIYHQKAFTRTYLLGEQREQPRYSLTFHTGLSGEPPVVLHAAADPTSPPLATIDYEDMRSVMTITLPTAPGLAATETMDYRMTFPYITFFFSVQVGPVGGGQQREQYEWRHSSGDAVASLGVRKTGWKLIRVVEDGTDDAVKAYDGSFRTRDGHEVVAALGYGDGKRQTAVAKFGFFGSGLTGALGERWALMAVVTALGIFQRDRSGWKR